MQPCHSPPRCSAAFFRKPLGTDRPCVVDVIDDGRDDLLHFEVRTDGRTLEFDLTEDLQTGLALEGWEFLVDFHPDFFRHGAADRWRMLATLPGQPQYNAYCGSSRLRLSQRRLFRRRER